MNSLQPGMVQAGFLTLVARLNAGVGVAGAQQEMDALAAQYRAENPKMPDSDPAMTVAGNLRRDGLVGSDRGCWCCSRRCRWF